jgi:hypothetical protein
MYRPKEALSNTIVDEVSKRNNHGTVFFYFGKEARKFIEEFAKIGFRVGNIDA